MKTKKITIDTNKEGQKRFYDFMSSLRFKEGSPDIEINGDSLKVGNYIFSVNTDKDAEDVLVPSEEELSKIKQCFSKMLEPSESEESCVVPFDDVLNGQTGYIVFQTDGDKENVVNFIFQKHNRIKSIKNSTDTEELIECINDKAWHNFCDNPMTRQCGFANYEKSEARMFGLAFLKSIESNVLREKFKKFRDKIFNSRGSNNE